jgi:hypothetical protein
MSTGIFTPLIGRFGNKCFQFCYARALAEREGCELITPDWEGQQIFEIEPTRSRQAGDREVGGYCQDQASLIYTRRQVREWFKLRPWVSETLASLLPKDRPVLGHRRVGDLAGYGYPVVSAASYGRALAQYGFSPDEFAFVTEENPVELPAFARLQFVPDFVRLMNARVLFRGNSTFSWFAATLGRGRVFSPVIEGLEGGREHDVPFVEGNWPRFCNLDFVTDLHLPE